MSLVILIDVISHLLISLFIAIVLWPYLGFVGLIFVLIASAYLIHAWMNGDLTVAARAGFRRATPVQQRYLEYLGTGQEVFTHPSILPVAGLLASSKRRLIVLTSGVFQLYERRELSENDMRDLMAKLSSRDGRAVFGWTFHLATGGARLFSKAHRGDPFAESWGEWGRKTLTIALVGGAGGVIMGVLLAASISTAFGRPIEIAPIIPVFWLPFAYLGARFLWRLGNAALIKAAAGNWNKPIALEQVTFLPMSTAPGSHPNLNLLRSGLLIADKRWGADFLRSPTIKHQ